MVSLRNQVVLIGLLESIPLRMVSAKGWSYPLAQHDFWSGVGCFAYNDFHAWQVFSACLKVVWRFK